jgi:hypothetical protein
MSLRINAKRGKIIKMSGRVDKTPNPAMLRPIATEFQIKWLKNPNANRNKAKPQFLCFGTPN